MNRFLNDMIEAGYVRVFNRTVRPFAYKVTDDGVRYQRRLGLEHYTWVLGSLQRLEQRIRSTLRELKGRGVKRVLGWEPNVGFTEGLRRTVEWTRANPLPVKG